MHELIESTGACHTLLERVWRWAQLQPDKIAFTLLNAQGGHESTVSYSELIRRASSVGLELARTGLTGRNVILMYAPGTEFVSTFLGCMLYGIVPIPVHAPKRNRPNAITNFVKSARVGAILLDRQTFSSVERVEGKRNWPNDIPWVVTDEIGVGTTLQETTKPCAVPGHLAFLQFTSGSISTPKGVMVTHENIMRNAEMMTQCGQTSPDSVFVNWLPHSHDLGLVASVLHSLYCGAHCIILSPTVVIAQPYIWLKAISINRGTYTAAPNFAYQRCVDKISPGDRDKLDLSSLRVAVNAAEPVHHQTLVNFSEYFRPAGFESTVFLPCYGMAEATVFISGGKAHEPPRFIGIDREQYNSKNRAVVSENQVNSHIVVGCGHSWLGQDIAVIDPVSLQRSQAGEVGEIWIAGKNVTPGYYENPQANMASFALLPENGGRYFRTGDLGFFYDNELFISGRLKDLIIICGVNYHPQDIEWLVEHAHADIHPSGIAAFAVLDGTTERLVIAVELKREAVTRTRRQPQQLNEIARAVCEAVSRNFEVAVDKVVMLRPGQLPKTSSGKVCRQEYRKTYIERSLDALAVWPDEDAIDSVARRKAMYNIEKALRIINRLEPAHLKVFSQLSQIMSDELQLNLVDLDIEKSIFFYGIDSIKLIDVHGRLEQGLGYQIPTETFFRAGSLVSLIDLIVESDDASRSNSNEHRLRDDVDHWLQVLTDKFSSVQSLGFATRKERAPILLTGASGYLGVYLLKELLDNTVADIYCVTRAMDEDAGWKRIQKNAQRYQLLMPANWQVRVKIIIGDTSKERLGLSPESYLQLTNCIGSVYHCAAIDNFYLPYDVIKETNALGLVRLAQFCMDDAIKPLYYVSSCAAALMDDNLKTTETVGLVNGYAQTKFVAERIVLGLIEKGFPAINYRLGYLYSLEADLADKEESFETFLASIFHLRCLPDIDIVFDLTPVEYAAKCIAKTSLESREQHKSNYTFYNPVPLKWVDVADYLLYLWPNMRIVPLSEFAELFREYVLLCDRKSVKLLKSVVSEKLEQQVNRMFRSVATDDIGLIADWCPPCDRVFAIHYLDLVLGTGKDPSERTRRA